MNAKQRRAKRRRLRVHFTGIARVVSHPFGRLLGPGWRLVYDPLADLTIALHKDGAWTSFPASVFGDAGMDSRWGDLATALHAVEVWPGGFEVVVHAHNGRAMFAAWPLCWGDYEAGDYARVALRVLERAKWLVEGVDRDAVLAAIAQVEPLVGLGRGE